MESGAPPLPKHYNHYQHTYASDALPNICARLVEWSEIMGYSLGKRTSLGVMAHNGPPEDDYNEFTSSKRQKRHVRYADNAGHELGATNKQKDMFDQEFRRNSPYLGGTENVDFCQASVTTDRREINVCGKCNKGGKLVVCGTNSCSFAIHESCLGSLSSFGRTGVFYCPFCAYFQAISKYVDVERKTYLMRKDLANFLCSRTIKELNGPPRKSCRTKQHQRGHDDGCLTLGSGDNPAYRGRNVDSTDGTPHPLHTDEKRTENTGQVSHSSRVHRQDEMAERMILKSQCENTSCQVPGKSIMSEGHAEVRATKGILRYPKAHLSCEYKCSLHTESADAKKRSEEEEESGVSKCFKRVKKYKRPHNYKDIVKLRRKRLQRMTVAEDKLKHIQLLRLEMPPVIESRLRFNALVGSSMFKSPRLCKQGSSNSWKIDVNEKCLKSSLNMSISLQERRSIDNLPEKLTWDPRDVKQLRVVNKELHASTTPETVVCREDEQNRILDFCKECVKQEKAGSLFLCGCPGTGKSLSMAKVISMLVDWAKEESVQPPDILSINCSSLTYTSEIFLKILGQNHFVKNNSQPTFLRGLQNLYSQKQPPGMKMILVIADELDYLITKDQAVLQDLFMLTTMPFSKCVLVGIANAIDLADRFIPKLQSLNCKPMVISFHAYSKDQIIAILQERLRALPYNVFQPQAVELCARGVAAASGDMRKALAVCRSAIELLISERRDPIRLSSSNMTKDRQKPFSPEMEPNQVDNLVKIRHVAAALSKVYKSPVVDTILSLPQHQQIILCSAVKLFRRGMKESTLGKLNKSYEDVCKSTRIPPVGFVELSSICRVLDDQGILKLGQSREDSLRKVTLQVDEADIVFALQGIRFLRKFLQ